MIRLLLVDDQDLIRRGLKALLGTDPTLEVVGEAANGQEAVTQVAHLNPDVVLMDVRMPSTDGVAGTQQICQQFPDTKVLMLTTFDDQEYVTQALQAGASGYLLKDTPFDELTQAIALVHKGYTQIGPGLATQVLTHPTPVNSGDLEPWLGLSEREQDIVRLVAQGHNNREIAQSLHIAEKTVKNYLTNILSQLGLRDRTQLAIASLKVGFPNR
ncbi:response regulator transcription factor [Cronbergia sp. UHCC 0137]|uniref:response regulator transcription factor n=1 Tax=Cronbergia sp. UHCC 0137 TaxID=3110239 RepID=UPI002B1EF15C|nr:response regulator transcription factor [Cronbergia sp. UHCC 0137]MEA5619142.1 response regulator transcription factor [Cronbergia sp. UHCC 0137]